MQVRGANWEICMKFIHVDININFIYRYQYFQLLRGNITLQVFLTPKKIEHHSFKKLLKLFENHLNSSTKYTLRRLFLMVQ